MTMTSFPPLDRTSPTFKADLDSLFGSRVPNFVNEANALTANLNSIAAGGAYAIPFIIKADPGPGALVPQQANQLTTAAWYIGESDSAGNSLTAVLNTFTASSSTVKGTVRIVKAGDPSKWIRFNVTGMTMNSGFRAIAVTPIDGSGPSTFQTNDLVMVNFQANGDKGDAGGPVVMHVREEQGTGANGVLGSNVSANLWQRTLNSTKTNDIPGASLSSNRVTLTSIGKYRFRVRAPLDVSIGSTQGARHKVAIYNVTDGAYVAIGDAGLKQNQGSGFTVMANIVSEAVGAVTITSSKTFEVRSFTPDGAYDGGTPANVGQVEVYTELIIEKI